jgi:hypothetical protein
MCSINRLLREGLAALRQEQIGAEDSVAPVEFLYRLTDAMANAEATSRSDQEDDFWFGQACRAPAKSRISRAALAWAPDSVDTARPSRQIIGPEK